MTVETYLQRTIVILTALLVDKVLGDPPNRWHPVAWIGSLIYFLKRKAPSSTSKLAKFLYGGFVVLFGIGLLGAIGWGIELLLASLPPYVVWIFGSFALKLFFSLRMLLDVALEIQVTLESGNLPEARRLVSWHLVSRDTSQLDQTQVTAAAVESIAENTTDSVISPLFYYLLLGFPGILIYRYANTCDAILGYRDEAREWLGKIPARFDDLLNLIPARVTAALLMLAATLPGYNLKGTIAVWWRDRYQTVSPNAGHPMSAAAGALGIVLDKVGVYVLGAGGRAAQPTDLGRTARLVRRAVYLGAGILKLSAIFWRVYAG